MQNKVRAGPCYIHHVLDGREKAVLSTLATRAHEQELVNQIEVIYNWRHHRLYC